MKNTTKVVSFRMPLKEYGQLIIKAADSGLDISEYCLARINTPEPDQKLAAGGSLQKDTQYQAALVHRLEWLVNALSDPKAKSAHGYTLHFDQATVNDLKAELKKLKA